MLKLNSIIVSLAFCAFFFVANASAQDHQSSVVDRDQADYSYKIATIRRMTECVLAGNNDAALVLSTELVQKYPMDNDLLAIHAHLLYKMDQQKLALEFILKVAARATTRDNTISRLVLPLSRRLDQDGLHPQASELRTRALQVNPKPYISAQVIEWIKQWTEKRAKQIESRH